MSGLVHLPRRMNWVFPQVRSLKTASDSFHLLHSFQRDSVPPAGTSSSASPPSPTISGSRISPAVLFIIIVLAVIFFISGLVHLVVRYIFKHQPSSSSPHSNNTDGGGGGSYPRDFSGTDALQRQLQQLFHLHDSGLDQAFIDALPVFLYKEMVGAKEPFDCAVCLCEFTEEDKLRLLPVCSHAFHINCIDTWLLSNSTCPLCRGSLFIPGLAFENPMFDLDDPREEEEEGVTVGEREDGLANPKPPDLEEGGGGGTGAACVTAAAATEKRVFPVRLGKFRRVQYGTGGDTNGGGNAAAIPVVVNDRSITGREVGESSSSNLDERRCYSMGSYQYVEGDSGLRVVALNKRAGNGDGRASVRRRVGMIDKLNPAAAGADDGLAGKKLSGRSQGESFSVSKIWQWSNKKGKFPDQSDTASLDDTFPWIHKKGGGVDT